MGLKSPHHLLQLLSLHIPAAFVHKNIHSFPIFLSLYFFFFFGQAFTEIQKKRLLSWKQQVQKLFRSFPRKSLLELSGYRQQRRYAEFWEGWMQWPQVGTMPPRGWDVFCCLQSRVQGGERVGKASAVKGTQQAVSLCVWSLPFPPIPPRLHGSKPALPSCAAYPQHRALSLLPFDDGISTGGSSKSCQVAEKKLEAFRGAVTEPGREHRVCSLQGDAGFWVILESIRVVPRKKISKSLLTTSAFVSFCIYSWFVAKHSCFIPQKDSVLEIIGNIGTLGMRFQESTFSSALPNKTWIC